MIIFTLNLLRSNYFAAVNEFIKTEICRNYETLRRTLSKISKNSKQQLMFTSDFISKTAVRVSRSQFLLLTPKVFETKTAEILQTIKGLKLKLYKKNKNLF